MKNGRARLPDEPHVRAFLIEATIRKEWPGMTRAEFENLSPEEVAYYLAYLEGQNEARPNPA